jgi:hypothetical protein
MQRLIVVVTLCLLTLTALGQSTSKYQVGMITDVKARQVAGDSASDAASYDVSVKVGGTIYVVCTRNHWANSPRSTKEGTNC